MEEGLVGISEASGMRRRIEIGGEIWEHGRSLTRWRKSKGYGLTVYEGEMAGVGEILDRVRRYEGEERLLKVGVNKVGVLKNLRRGRGLCGKWEQKVRKWGKE